MDIKPLLDLACCKIATYLYKKKKHEIPAVFGVSCDFTPEDEAEIYTEYPWVREMRERSEKKLNETVGASLITESTSLSGERSSVESTKDNS